MLDESTGPGKSEFSISLQARLAGAPLPSLEIGVGAEVTTNVEIDPSNLQFGAIPQGGQETQTVTLASRNGEAFEVQSLHCDEARGVAVQAATIDSFTPDRMHFDVIQSAVERGPVYTTIRFQVLESELDSSYEIAIPVHYYGLADAANQPASLESSSSSSQ